MAKHRIRLKAIGVCATCGQRESVPGMANCQKCRAADGEQAAKRKADRRAAGLCPSCGRAGPARRKYCPAHLKRGAALNAARARQRKAAGLCLYGACAEPLASRAYCERHLAEMRERARRYWKAEKEAESPSE
jgi:hypothetical protein